MPDLAYESLYTGIICGVDEAGRGPLAGPVVAAAVILDQSCIPKGLNDSKKLSRVKRERLIGEIQAQHMWAVGVASAEEIDDINILQASMLAMQRAVEALTHAPDIALIDGNRAPKLSCRAVPIVKGDSLSLSIAAASIIAKVTRDRMMEELAKIHPEYGFERHAGYGTAKHLEALKRFGACKVHRKTFAPVAETLALFEVA